MNEKKFVGYRLEPEIVAKLKVIAKKDQRTLSVTASRLLMMGIERWEEESKEQDEDTR
jgi:hypothetical protein